MVSLKKFNVQYQTLVRDINIEILLNVLVVPWSYSFDLRRTLGLDHGVLNEVQDYPQQTRGGGLSPCRVQVKYNLEHTPLCKEGTHELAKHDQMYQCLIKIFKINLHFLFQSLLRLISKPSLLNKKITFSNKSATFVNKRRYLLQI